MLCYFKAYFIVFIIVIFFDITHFHGVQGTIRKLKGLNMFASNAISRIVSYIIARNIHKNHPVMPFL
jgi:hypothetical protein